MTDLLKDKVAIVAGTGEPARTVARALHAEGATVVVAAADEPAARAVTGGLDRGEPVRCDTADDARVEELVGGVLARHGAIDVLVTTTGPPAELPLGTMSAGDWRGEMSAQLDGVFSCVRHAGRAMAAAEGGSIIAVTGVAGLGGLPRFSAYAAAQAGVLSLVRSAAAEWRDHHVRVNTICSGWPGGPDAALDAAFTQRQGRLIEPADLAPLVVFLASERSRFSTGSTFVVDGGLSASLV